MVKFGFCVNLTQEADNMAGITYAPVLAEAGYDYIELPADRISRLSETEYKHVLAVLQDCVLPCMACNNFLPSSLCLTGEEVTPIAEVKSYLEFAFERIASLGAKVVVFGSPWSRNCPPGFDFARAEEQVADFLITASEMASGITIAIENNNKSETNMMNLVADVGRMVSIVGRENVKMHCDYYHLRFAGEAPEVLYDFPGQLAHIHIARLKNRSYFTSLDGEVPEIYRFADVLRKLDYSGGLSIEALGKAEAAQNLKIMKQVFS